MKLLKAMATVGGLTGVSRILGFIRDVMTATILGAGPVADAFIVALKLPNFFRRITAEGAFSVSFVPMYTKKRQQEGDTAADAFASNTFGVMCMVLTPFVLICMALMPVIIKGIAPGFDVGTERYDLSVEMTRVTFPYLLLISLSALLGGVLNAHDRFMPFAATPIVFNLTLIGALLILEPHLASGGHALSWGLFIAGFLQVIGLMYFIRKTKIDIKFKLPKFDADTKHLFRLMGPGVLGAGVMHVNLFVDVIIASTLAEGSISYLYYADRLNQLPLGMVGIAVGTALLPMLSRAFAGDDVGQARHLYNRAMEVCLLLALPAGVAMMVAAEPLIKSLFQYGAFDAKDAHTTAMVLTGYAIGVAPYVAGKVLSTAYYSRQDTKTPVKMAVICALMNIGLSLVLIKPFGVAGIAFSTGICGWVQCFLLWKNLKGVDETRLDDRFKRVLPRIIFSCCVMAAVLFMVSYYSSGYYDGNKFEKISALIVLVASGLATYSLAVFGTGALKISEIKSLFIRKNVR